LTVDEAARRLKVHPETVRRWLRRGAMRGALIGGDRAGYRVPATEVESRLRGQRPLQLPESDAGDDVTLEQLRRLGL
jgi:excisionase family DNA binding protein